MKPREWWNNLPNSNNRITLQDAKDQGYCLVSVLGLSEDKYERLQLVNRLIDNENTLGIERDDWIFLNDHFVFTNKDLAVLFKLVVI